MSEAPKPTKQIRELLPVEYLMLLVIGEQRKRRHPVTLHELSSMMLPHPIDDTVDELGAMGLLRPADSDRGLPMHGTVKVTPMGWIQLATQRRRVMRRIEDGALDLEARAEATAEPKDPKRTKDPSGAKEFKRQAKNLLDMGEKIERLVEDVLKNAPLPDTVRRAMDEENPENPAGEIGPQRVNDEEFAEELELAADPANAGRVRVDRPADVAEALADIQGDAAQGADSGEEETAPDPRRRRNQG